MNIYFSYIYGSAECWLIRSGKSTLSCGSGQAQALMQACSMFLDSEIPGEVLSVVKAEEGQTHAFPSACVISPNIPLAEASHVAKFKIKE